jgi:Domain of unknown function (DUF4105)
MRKPKHSLSPKRAWRRGLKIAALWILLLLPLFAFAQETPKSPGDDLDVALITFGPGEEVWERFGHNAILIRDRASGVQKLYNYGMFDFAQENFFLNFARGRMMYRIAVSDPAQDFPIYREEGRWIVQQDLNFTPTQRAALRDALDVNARPENAQYRYDYFRSNCSTRVRDMLDATVNGAIRNQTIAPSRGFTYRMDALRLMRPDLLVMLGIDAGLGPLADRRLTYWDESFVPSELMRHVRDVRVSDPATGESRALVARETRLAEARVPDPNDYPPAWIWRALIVGIVFALLLLGLSALRRRIWARALFGTVASVCSLVLGLAGIVLLGLWLLTDHESAWRNENLLLFDPLCLLLLPCWLSSFRARWRPSVFALRIGLLIALLAGVAFFVKVLPAFPQDNRFWIALLLPIQIAFAVALTRSHSRRV